MTTRYVMKKSKKKDSLKSQLLEYLSNPHPGLWIKASALSVQLKAPLEQVEFTICRLTDEGLACGIRDEATGEYWLLNLWQQVLPS